MLNQFTRKQAHVIAQLAGVAGPARDAPLGGVAGDILGEPRRHRAAEPSRKRDSANGGPLTLALNIDLTAWGSPGQV